MDRLNSDQYLLQWNTYEAWDAPVLQYDVFRLLEDGAVEIIESLSPGQTQLEVSAGNLVYAYFVEAIEAEGNGFGFSDTSRSNHVILNRVPEILLPNAFKPNGNKQEFKPVLKFLEDGQYRMFIFDRWGQLIYESRDPLEGWDGRFNGEYVSMGTYICVVTYSRNGESIEKKGTITVVY
ncbi:MAG: gliding motility-associated C-terminal domain-containing protein [Bacteroidales bacterium]|nr:gliding motility-associated C-terminal domain-containing protein [Bacteroidales bacterium]MCF8387135.1 gliding motility-associated C-terminal domain-containing protein [Bacteroidales bacterium]MCF8398870.1 gliding motility-associated C-terminal domain-containing protein [Bacteroidales bacterium]